jgi:PAS domain S-box-containing protein
MQQAPRNLLAALVEQAPDAIIFADREGNIQVWNGGAERVFGYAAEEVVGKRLDVIIPDRLRAAHWAAFDRAISSGVTRYDGRAMTTRSMHKDSRKLFVDLSFALIRDEAGAVIGALAVGRDATARYEEHRSLVQRVAELERGSTAPP